MAALVFNSNSNSSNNKCIVITCVINFRIRPAISCKIKVEEISSNNKKVAGLVIKIMGIKISISELTISF